MTSPKQFCMIVMLSMVGVAHALDTMPSSSADSAESAVRSQMEGFIKNKESRVDVGAVVKKYGYSVVATAEEYIENKDSAVRLHAYAFIDAAASHSANVVERQNAVGKLLKAAFRDPVYVDNLLDRLTKYRSRDFSSSSMQLLRGKFADRPKYRVILLVGAAGDESRLEALAQIRDAVKKPLRPWGIDRQEGHGLAFAAMMARARMGVKEDVERCIELVESYPDEGFRVVVLLKRLSYVRQPEVVEYLKSYLFSDKYEPGPPTQLRRTYAQCAIAALLEMLEDFPTKDKKFHSLPELTRYCREWMSKQKQWKIIR